MSRGLGDVYKRQAYGGPETDRKQDNRHKSTITMDTNISELTRGEEEIMQILWRLGDAVVNDIIARTDEPHPKYTTVATFLKILENKGFVSHRAEGKSHRYFPLIGREEYARGVMSSMLSNYFDGSLAQLVSFFSRHENIPAREMDEILEIMRNAKK